MKQKNNEEIKDKELSDEEYWKQYALNKNEDGFESQQNHEISIDVDIKFRGLNEGIVYETREKDINCNVNDLNTFFNNLKRVIRMVDETVSDKETRDGGL